MAKQALPMKKTRARYSDAYREEVLALADRVGAAAAARELGLQPSQLYQWRAKAQQKKITSDREQKLAMRTPDLSGNSLKCQRNLP